MNQFQSVDEVMAALRRRAYLIVPIFLLGCVLSLYFAANMIKMYEATAVVQIEEARIPEAMSGAAAEGEDATLRLRLIEQRLMARDNVIAIMDDLEIYTDDPELSLNERVARMRESVRIVEIRDDSPSWQRGAATGLYITAQDDDPVKAAALANELARSLVEQSATRAETRVRDTFDFFNSESERVEADITAIENRIATFKRENARYLPEGLALLRSEAGSLREADLRLDQEIVTLQSNSERQREEVLDRQIALLQEQKALIAARLTRIEEQIREAPEVERTLGAMERELSRLQEQYTVITRRTAEAEMGQMLEDRAQSDRFEILETALVPEFSISRSRKRTAMMGAFASLLLGIGAAFLAEMRNPAIRTPAQMERALGLQPVVSIPPIKTRRDIRGRRIKWGAALLAVALAIFGVMRFFGEKIWQLGLDRILPRLSQT